MNIRQSPVFRKVYKKLHSNQLEGVNESIRHILSEPYSGEEKRGYLAGVRVYKFSVQNKQFLLAYEFDKDDIFLLALGVHENIYRDLKKHRYT